MKKKSKNETKISVALYHLLLKKSIDKIKISELCKDAGVSRMSFYRNFNNIDDIFVKFCDERFEEFYQNYVKINNMSGHELLKNTFAFMKKYSRQIKVLKSAKKDAILISQFHSYISYLRKTLDEQEASLIKNNPVIIPFLAGGFYNVLMNWVDSDFSISSDEMASYIIELIGK